MIECAVQRDSYFDPIIILPLPEQGHENKATRKWLRQKEETAKREKGRYGKSVVYSSTPGLSRGQKSHSKKIPKVFFDFLKQVAISIRI
jgi:hypothetical protein